MSASIESGVAIFHAVGEEIFFFLKKTLRVKPGLLYSKEHGRDRDKNQSILKATPSSPADHK